MMTAQDIIKLFDLKPLPEEGGYYKEVYRANGKIPHNVLKSHSGDRSYSTAIYYLITPTEFSGFHRVCSDEIFHFYMGDTVEMVQITSKGELKRVLIGNNLSSDTQPQVIVPADVWQGTRLVDGGTWALLGCTVAPGFEFADFEGGSFEELLHLFPQHEKIFRKYIFPRSESSFSIYSTGKFITSIFARRAGSRTMGTPNFFKKSKVR